MQAVESYYNGISDGELKQYLEGIIRRGKRIVTVIPITYHDDGIGNKVITEALTVTEPIKTTALCGE